MADPERIYLEPDCCADPSTGRMWCEDNPWPTCGDCEKTGVEYVRADTVAGLRRAVIEATLSLKAIGEPAPSIGPPDARICSVIAVSALERIKNATGPLYADLTKDMI